MSDQPISVPLLDLRAQYTAIHDEIDAALAPVLESQYFVLGPTVDQFERAMAAYLGCRHAIGCASGSDALLLPLMALGVGPGDEVICPAFTFFATAGTIARTGATPVFCDIDPVTYNIDPASLRERAAACRNLKAIMPVHLYGQSADTDAIQDIADKHGVPVIEDAAQAVGARDQHGDRIGARSLVHGWSFYPTKNLGAFGDAGMVTTNDDTLAEKMRRLRVHGGKDRYFHDMVGMNSRLDALQAAVLNAKLPHLDQWNVQRRENATFYDEAFAHAGAKSSASAWDEGGLPLRYPHLTSTRAHHVYHQYVIRVPADLRDPLRDHLRAQKIGSEVFYPLPLHLQECFSTLGGKAGDLPAAEAVAREVIAIPIYPELTRQQLKHVATTIVSYVEAHTPAVAKS